MTETERSDTNAQSSGDSRVPVDRGWAWVILFASFLISVINVGTEKAFGLFFIEFLRTFKSDVATTALLSSVMEIIHAIISVMVLTVGLKWMTVRTSVCLGITISALGYGISSFSISLVFLILSQGLLLGSGIAFYNTPIFILIGDYFDKRKELANAVFISGNAMGGFLMPLLYRYILDEYGLHGGLILTCGVVLNSVVAATLLRPTTFYTGKKSKPRIVKRNNQNTYTGPTDKTGYDSEDNISIDGDDTNMYLKRSSEIESSNLNSKFPCTSDPLLYVHQNHEQNGIRPRANTGVTNTGNIQQLHCREQLHCRDKPVLDKINVSGFVRYISQSELASSSVADLRQVKNKNDEDVSRRFHQNVLNNLKSLNLSLFRNGPFILFIAIYSFGNIAIGTAHIYTPTFAKDIGISDQKISIMVSVISLTDFCGRILAGYVADKSWMSPPHIVLISQIVIACIMQFTVFFTEFWHLMVFVTLYGSTSGVIAALFPPMMLQTVGKEQYRKGMAVFVVALGVVFTLTIPFLGYLRDTTHSYHAAFKYISCCSFITIALLILQDILQKKTKCYKQNEETGVDLSC